MAEYTPSEEWAYIRNAYARSQKNETFGSEEETEDARGEALREFDDTLAAHDARVRRHAWQEGYDQGAEDGITSEQMQVGIGLGGIARPARTNPYEETP